MKENAMEKPNRTNFHLILNPAFILSFCAKNIYIAFKKTGICPFSSDVITSEALTASQLTNKPVPEALQQNRQESNISPLENPVSLPSVIAKPKRKIREKSAKCITPPDGPTTPTSEASAGTSKELTPTYKSKKTKSKRDEDWICGVCSVTFSEDACKKNGAKWVQCS
jgi:hypothetical protein